MHLLRRSLVAAALMAGLAVGAGSASAQNYPTKPVTVVVPFAAGGAADVLARLLTQNIQLGQPMVVEARPGAGATIGAGYVARSAPDGHTLLFVAAGHAGTGALYPNLPYHPVDSFAPVIGLAAAPVVIAVRADSPIRTIQDFVAHARANPGKLNCAGGGGGATLTNLALESIKSEFKLQIANIPYKGSNPAITALLGGEIDCDSDAIASLIPHIKAGKLRALAVTSRQRSPMLPDVPSIAETILPGFDATAWYGILAPKGTPQPVLDRLQREFAAAMRNPQVLERFRSLGAEPLDMDGPAFGRYLASEAQRWGDLIRKLGITAN